MQKTMSMTSIENQSNEIKIIVSSHAIYKGTVSSTKIDHQNFRQN